MEPGMFGIPGPDLFHPPKGTVYLPPLWGNARFGHGGETGAASRTGGGGRYHLSPFTNYGVHDSHLELTKIYHIYVIMI